MMKALIYLSRNLKFTSDEDLCLFICKNTHPHHKSLISGYVYSDQDYFLQYIEGEAGVVDQLWSDIQNDLRHKVLYMTCINIEKLRFSVWSFKHFTESTQVEILLYQYLIQQMQILASKSFKSKLFNFFNQDTSIWKIVDQIKTITGPLTIKAG